MGEMILTVVAAFLLFMVGLPLLGFVTGVVARVVAPYGLGALLIYQVLGASLSPALVLPATALAIALWCALLMGVRAKQTRLHGLALSWGEGHYRAAVTLLSLGLLQRIFFPDGEWRGLFAEDEEWEWREI